MSQQPTREEVEAMSDSGLLNLYVSGNTDATVEILRRLSHYRALLASQPRVWTAEEWIMEERAGCYRTGSADEDGSVMWSMFYSAEQIRESFSGYTHLYGPMDEQEGPDSIPQPTTPNKEKT